MKTSIRKSVTKTQQSNLKEVVMKGKLVLMAVCFILASYGIAGAGEFFLTDQAYTPLAAGWYNLSFYKFAQEFKPSHSSMDEVRLLIHTTQGENSCGSEPPAVIINIREDSLNGNIVATAFVNTQWGSTALETFWLYPRALKLDPGRTYIIEVSADEYILPCEKNTTSIGLNWEGGGYPQGLMYITDVNSNVTEIDKYDDLIFVTGNFRTDTVKLLSGAAFCNRVVKPSEKLIIAFQSDDVLDATQIDPESVIFSGAGIKRTGKNGRFQCHEEDINNDSRLDLVCNIDASQVVIEPGIFVNVSAETYGGMTILGAAYMAELCAGLN